MLKAKSVVVLMLMLISSVAAGQALACPELNNVDLASSYDRDEYIEVHSERLPKLSKKEFLKYPAFSEFEYEYCSDALVLKQLEATQTGNIYTVVISIEDHCDGGNSYGNILDESGEKVLGSIGDSFISCF